LCVGGWEFDSEDAGCSSKLGDDTAQLRLHAAHLRGSELGRDDKGRQALQRLADALQAPLALGGNSRDADVLLRLCPHESQRAVQKAASFRTASHSVGAQQRERLVHRQPVAFDAAQQGILFSVGECTQRVRQGGADPCPSDGVRDLGRQPCRDIHPSGHPRGFSVQKPRDRRGTQPIVGPEGADHAPFIQNGEGAGGRVGQKQQALVLLRFAGPLQHRRDEPPPALPPRFQPFEAVDDFVASVGHGHDTDGQLGDALGTSRGTARSERGVASAQALDGQQA
jgi:hypothetical protein